MPDAARLVAAICLAITAFLGTELIKDAFLTAKEYERFNFGWFSWVNVAVGVLVGWIFMGSRAGRGVSNAITNGITGVFLLILNALLIQSCNEMMRLAMRNRYGDALEAIAAVFEIGAEWSLILLSGPVLLFFAVAAVISGLLTEYAWRRWR